MGYWSFENSEDPDQLASYEDSHCFHLHNESVFVIKNTTLDSLKKEIGKHCRVKKKDSLCPKNSMGIYYPFVDWKLLNGYFGNSEDPDEMLHNATALFASLTKSIFNIFL